MQMGEKRRSAQLKASNAPQDCRTEHAINEKEDGRSAYQRDTFLWLL
jgi:hypothetical protein